MDMQQASTQATMDVAARTAEVVDGLKSLEGPLLPILHGIQREFGYVPDESLPLIANALNLSRAEVYGVVTFYHDYRRAPAGRHVLKLCQAEACQSMGSVAVAAKIKQTFGIGFHETSKDGSVTLEPVYCLGLCSAGPAARVGDRLHARLDADRLAEVIGNVR